MIFMLLGNVIFVFLTILILSIYANNKVTKFVITIPISKTVPISRYGLALSIFSNTDDVNIIPAVNENTIDAKIPKIVIESY